MFCYDSSCFIAERESLPGSEHQSRRILTFVAGGILTNKVRAMRNPSERASVAAVMMFFVQFAMTTHCRVLILGRVIQTEPKEFLIFFCLGQRLKIVLKSKFETLLLCQVSNKSSNSLRIVM